MSLPSDRFDLKTLITEENLIASGFFSANVGVRVPYKKFRKGVAVKVKTPLEGDREEAEKNVSASDNSDDGNNL